LTLILIFSARVNFEGLFGERQKELADTTNLFFNENWREIIKEIKPAVSEALAVLYSDIFDKVFGTIPYEELFLS
jgi:Haemolymph juvenile hormone binding protein (JHBP)